MSTHKFSIRAAIVCSLFFFSIPSLAVAVVHHTYKMSNAEKKYYETKAQRHTNERIADIKKQLETANIEVPGEHSTGSGKKTLKGTIDAFLESVSEGHPSYVDSLSSDERTKFNDMLDSIHDQIGSSGTRRTSGEDEHERLSRFSKMLKRVTDAVSDYRDAVLAESHLPDKVKKLLGYKETLKSLDKDVEDEMVRHTVGASDHKHANMTNADEHNRTIRDKDNGSDDRPPEGEEHRGGGGIHDTPQYMPPEEHEME